METVIFIIVMVLVHILMMHFMPGMHGGHAHEKNGHTDKDSLEKEKMEEENRQLKNEVYALKSEVRRNERWGQSWSKES